MLKRKMRKPLRVHGDGGSEVNDSVIAIRTADRKLVPVLSGSQGTRRRMVLTTVHDNQPSVHIDLFQMESETDDQSDYIGSLVIEHLQPSPAGAPDISLEIGIDEQGNLNATASDSSSGDYQSLSVSLRDADGAMQDLPDFSLSDEGEEESFDDFDLSDFDEPGLVDFDEDEADADAVTDADTGADADISGDTFSMDEDSGDEPDFSFDDDDAFELPDIEDDAAAQPVSVDETVRSPAPEQAVEESSVPRLLFVAYIILAIAILTGLIFIVYRLLEGDPVPPLEAAFPILSTSRRIWRCRRRTR